MPESDPAATRTPIVARLEDLATPPELQSAAIKRFEAFTGDARWIGFARTTPGEWSSWHHHGTMDTYFYVLAGTLEFEYGADRQTVAVEPGAFAFLPGGVVHRERTAPGGPGEAVVIRLGTGPSVVNVDAP